MPPKKVNNCDNCHKSYSSKFLHQCLQCSKDGQAFICDHCSGQHDHFSNDKRFSKLNDHATTSKKEDKKAVNPPIHSQDDLLQQFANTLGLTVKQAKEVSALNQIKVVDQESKQGKVIGEYFTNSFKKFATIQNIYSMSNKSQDKKLEKTSMNTTNEVMLWNGTLYQNVSSLLTNGFQIPNQHDRVHKKPEHLVFHDRIVPEAAIKVGRSDQQGVLLLCEVTLGRIDIQAEQHLLYRNPDAKFDSIKVLGRNWPDEFDVKYIGKTKVPVGVTVFKKSSMDVVDDYNRYAVFDVERINIKYIVHYELN